MKKTIIYPSTVNYTFLFQRPQQLMKMFGKYGFNCIFIDNGAKVEGCTPYTEPTLVSTNLTVYPIEYYHTKGKLHEGSILYYTYPPTLRRLTKLNPSFTIFDCIDEPAGIFAHWNSGHIWENSVKNADIVPCSAIKLHKMAKKYNKEAFLVPNGCDFEHFKPKEWDVPEDLKNLPGRKITFSGAIAPWLDIQLIYEVAQNYPNDSIVLVGYLYDMVLKNAPSNIYVLGHKDYKILPAYLHHSDVLIIPFNVNDPVIEATNPIKLWEYLATGKPIVTTNIPEVTMESSIVRKTRSQRAFIKWVGRSIWMDRPRKQKQRIELAKKNSWNERCLRILKKMGEFGIELPS